MIKGAKTGEQEIFTRSVIDSLSAQIAVLDNEGKIISVNRSWKNFSIINGNPDLKNVGIDTNYLEMLVRAKNNGDPDVEVVINGLNRILTGKDDLFEHEYRCDSETEVRWFQMRVTPLEGLTGGVVVSHENITEKKMAALDLKKREQDFTLMAEQTGMALYDFDIRTGKIKWRGAIDEIMGYSPSEFSKVNIGKWEEFIFPGDRERVMSVLKETMKTRERFQTEYRFRVKSGEYIAVEDNGVYLYEGDKAVRMVGVIKDITQRRAYQESLELSERSYHELFEHGLDLIYILDFKGLIRNVNHSVIDKYSIKKNEIIGKKFTEFLVLDQKEAGVIQKYLEQAIEGEKVKFSWWSPGKGRKFLQQFVMKRGYYFKGEVLIISGYDITDQWEAREELRKNLDLLAESQNISNIGSYELDFDTGKTTYSDEAYRIYGFSPGDPMLTREKINESVHPDDKQILDKKNLSQEIEKNRGYEIEYRYITPGTKKLKYLRSEGKIRKYGGGLKFIGTLQDITRQKEYEENIIRQELKFKQLFENSPFGIVLLDENYCVKEVNKSFTKTFHFENDDLRGKDLIDFVVPPEFVVEAKKVIARSLKGKRSGIEGLRLTKEGKKIPVYFFPVPIYHDKNLFGYFAIYINLSEQKKAEASLKEMTKELLNYNSELEQFAYVTSHNLRAPVANLLGLSELYDPSSDNEFNRMILENTRNTALRLDRTIRDLIKMLKMNKPSIKDLEKINLEEIVEEVKEELKQKIIQKDAEIQTDFREADRLFYPRALLHSYLLNLISNGLKYSSPGRKPIIEVKSFRHLNFIGISVSDNGIGIDLPTYGDKIFKMYQQFHHGKEGQGLGLYIVKKQLERNGGFIEVESQPGKGTTFKFYLKELEMKSSGDKPGSIT